MARRHSRSRDLTRPLRSRARPGDDRPICTGHVARHPAPTVIIVPIPSGAAAVPLPFQATGVYPSVGIALQPFFDLLRFEVAKGTRHGTWQFNVDFSRDFWGVL